jgi:DNA-binding transcriptional regulator YiaG
MKETKTPSRKVRAEKQAPARCIARPPSARSASVQPAGAKSPHIVQRLAQRFGLRQETLSRMTGFSVRAVAEWAGGKEPSAPAKRAFTEMDRLLDGLSRVMEPGEVGRWLKETNSAFDGSTPLQVIERGQTDRIWRMLYHVESGEPG